MSTLRTKDRQTDALLDFIAQVESDGNYDAVIGNAHPDMELAKLTIRQIYSLQIALIHKTGRSSAVGRYQILHQTLKDLVTRYSIAEKTKFTPVVQDHLASLLLKKRGYDKWQRSLITDVTFTHELSKEWASFPDPLNKGKSHYDNVAGNHAAYSLDQVYEVLTALKDDHAPIGA
jgi:muramidase (phage lysozyme)